MFSIRCYENNEINLIVCSMANNKELPLLCVCSKSIFIFKFSLKLINLFISGIGFYLMWNGSLTKLLLVLAKFCLHPSYAQIVYIKISISFLCCMSSLFRVENKRIHYSQDPREEVIQAWYMDDSNEDQRLPHHKEPKEFVSLDELAGKHLCCMCLFYEFSVWEVHTGPLGVIMLIL